MKKKQHHECEHCEGVFRIGHDMDSEYFAIKYCPFCGEELTEEDRAEAWDIDEIGDVE